MGSERKVLAMTEMMTEVRRVLEELVAICKPPKIASAEWLHDAGNIVDNLRAVRERMTQGGGGVTFTLPPRAGLVQGEGVLGPIQRLLALLSMSPGERAFVTAIADAVVAGEPIEAWDQLAIFSDWVAENLNAGENHPIRLLRPRTGDVLVTYHQTGQSPEASKAMRVIACELTKDLEAELRKRGIDVAFHAALPTGWSIERLPANRMRNAGWVRVEEAQRMVREETLACAQMARDAADADLEAIPLDMPAKEPDPEALRHAVRGSVLLQLADRLEERYRQMEPQEGDPPT